MGASLFACGLTVGGHEAVAGMQAFIEPATPRSGWEGRGGGGGGAEADRRDGPRDIFCELAVDK